MGVGTYNGTGNEYPQIINTKINLTLGLNKFTHKNKYIEDKIKRDDLLYSHTLHIINASKDSASVLVDVPYK